MDKIIFKFIWEKEMFKNTHENYKNRRIIAPNLTVMEDFSPWKLFESSVLLLCLPQCQLPFGSLIKTNGKHPYHPKERSGFPCFST